jgi:hypothetical protein
MMATKFKQSRPHHSCCCGAQDVGGTAASSPVVEDPRVVGMISDRDICMAAFTQGGP